MKLVVLLLVLLAGACAADDAAEIIGYYDLDGSGGVSTQEWRQLVQETGMATEEDFASMCQSGRCVMGELSKEAVAQHFAENTSIVLNTVRSSVLVVAQSTSPGNGTPWSPLSFAGAAQRAEGGAKGGALHLHIRGTVGAVGGAALKDTNVTVWGGTVECGSGDTLFLYNAHVAFDSVVLQCAVQAVGSVMAWKGADASDVLSLQASHMAATSTRFRSIRVFASTVRLGVGCEVRVGHIITCGGTDLNKASVSVSDAAQVRDMVCLGDSCTAQGVLCQSAPWGCATGVCAESKECQSWECLTTSCRAPSQRPPCDPCALCGATRCAACGTVNVCMCSGGEGCGERECYPALPGECTPVCGGRYIRSQHVAPGAALVESYADRECRHLTEERVLQCGTMCHVLGGMRFTVACDGAVPSVNALLGVSCTVSSDLKPMVLRVLHGVCEEQLGGYAKAMCSVEGVQVAGPFPTLAECRASPFATAEAGECVEAPQGSAERYMRLAPDSCLYPTPQHAVVCQDNVAWHWNGATTGQNGDQVYPLACPRGKVLAIIAARYQCLSRDVCGLPSDPTFHCTAECVRSVLAEVELLCAGRQQCTLLVNDYASVPLPTTCPKHGRHIDVRYTCQDEVCTKWEVTPVGIAANITRDGCRVLCAQGSMRCKEWCYCPKPPADCGCKVFRRGADGSGDAWLSPVVCVDVAGRCSAPQSGTCPGGTTLCNRCMCPKDRGVCMRGTLCDEAKGAQCPRCLDPPPSARKCGCVRWLGGLQRDGGDAVVCATPWGDCYPAHTACPAGSFTCQQCGCEDPLRNTEVCVHQSPTGPTGSCTVPSPSAPCPFLCSAVASNPSSSEVCGCEAHFDGASPFDGAFCVVRWEGTTLCTSVRRGCIPDSTSPLSFYCSGSRFARVARVAVPAGSPFQLESFRRRLVEVLNNGTTTVHNIIVPLLCPAQVHRECSGCPWGELISRGCRDLSHSMPDIPLVDDRERVVDVVGVWSAGVQTDATAAANDGFARLASFFAADPDGADMQFLGVYDAPEAQVSTPTPAPTPPAPPPVSRPTPDEDNSPCSTLCIALIVLLILLTLAFVAFGVQLYRWMVLGQPFCPCIQGKHGAKEESTSKPSAHPQDTGAPVAGQLTDGHSFLPMSNPMEALNVDRDAGLLDDLGEPPAPQPMLWEPGMAALGRWGTRGTADEQWYPCVLVEPLTDGDQCLWVVLWQADSSQSILPEEDIMPTSGSSFIPLASPAGRGRPITDEEREVAAVAPRDSPSPVLQDILPPATSKSALSRPSSSSSSSSASAAITPAPPPQPDREVPTTGDSTQVEAADGDDAEEAYE
eukprot:Sspe_Gene.74283::Locus_45891_Transcript_1_1_Confidence_1.000_Length_4319::g.74283::m.74283